MSALDDSSTVALDTPASSLHHVQMYIAPPQSEEVLLQRCHEIAGVSLGELASRHAVTMPENLRRHKGWVGQLLERVLGADANSLAEPDFRAIGVELKTLPIGGNGQPRESTYVCTVPLEEGLEASWEESWVRRKLSRVLWLPVEAVAEIPLAQRRVGTALLWSPSEEDDALLRRDWEELAEMICMGELEKITARMGSVLQIRPKAANAKVRCKTVGADGEAIVTNPRGYYLRPGFTRTLLQRYL